MDYRLFKVDYTWNFSIYACECNKECGLDEHLRNCSYTKSDFYKLVMFCDKVVKISEAVLNSINKLDYYFVHTIALVVMCLLLLIMFAIIII